MTQTISNQTLLQIAKKNIINCVTFKTTNSHKDFFEVATWEIHAALKAAYLAGQQSNVKLGE